MKYRMAICLALAIALLLGGCGAKNAPAQTAPAAGTTETAETPDAASARFSFETVDMDGNPVSSADYADVKVIMVNMWEPWCGPCVGEMPDLQALYEKYQSQGFLILGVSTSPAADVKETAASLGITYPILAGNAQFRQFETGYVPTTVFLAGDGRILSESPEIGGKSAGEWDRIIQSYLQG